MKAVLILRFSLELAILFPAVLFSLLPVTRHLRHRPLVTYGAAFALCALFSGLGGIFCARFGWSANRLLLPSLFLFFAAYSLYVNLSLEKKLFCFLNAGMLCGFCTFYTRLLTSPAELGRDDEPFLVSSSLTCLLLALILGLVFLRTLVRKISYLLEEENLNKVWPRLSLTCFLLVLLLLYANPQSAEVVMTGRVRSASLLFFLLFPAAALFFCHNLWWTATQITEKAKLTQENSLLQIERKRYEELSACIDEARILRHDFRHHLLVIDQLAKAGEMDRLFAYLQQLREKSDTPLLRRCANKAVDAIASHYDSLASQQQTQIQWTLRLPDRMPWQESDLCAVLGNLTENALHAVALIPPDARKISVTSRMLSPFMLGISVENPYTGQLQLNKKGLPGRPSECHGIGLTSISSIVTRYHGTMSIQTKENVFSVNILLMSPS